MTNRENEIKFALNRIAQIMTVSNIKLEIVHRKIKIWDGITGKLYNLEELSNEKN